MPAHKVQFSPSGRSTLAAEGSTILRAAELASEPVSAECGGRGACGRCLVRILQGQVPEYRVLRRESGFPDVLACLTPVHGPLTVQPLVEAQLPKLISGDRYIGVEPLAAWAPWPLALAPLLECREPQDLGVALDIGTTTLRLLLIRLSDGAIVGEAGAYNPQIPKGADVISRIVAESGGMELSVIGGGGVRGLCGSGLIALADALFRAGWIDRGGRMTARVPGQRRVEGKWGAAIALSTDQRVALWERDLASLIRAKAAVFAGIRSLVNSLGPGGPGIERAYVSGNFGRYLNLPAAVGIGLLPDIPPGRYGYIDNGSLEGAALSLLSREFFAEIARYLTRVTYVDLSDLPGYMDEFVGASFLPHTSPDLLRMG